MKLSGAIWIAMALLGVLLWGRSQRTEGELRQQIAAREKVIASLARDLASTQGRIPKVDTVRKVDATSARMWEARYQRLRDSLQYPQLLADSANSVPILVAADSAVHSCLRALTSCETAVALRDTALWQAGRLIDSQRVQIRDLKKRHGFRLFGLIRLACTAGADVLHARPGITCGVPVLR